MKIYKTSVIFACLQIVIFAGNAHAQPLAKIVSEQPVLKPNVTVDSAIINLSDLFSNAGILGEVPVAYAPKPGQRAIFDARWLFRAAKTHGLKWQPLSPTAQTVVQRTSVIISRKDIENLIIDALKTEGLDADMSIELSNKFLRLHLPTKTSTELEISDFVYQQRTNRFSAIINVPTGERQDKRLRITGRAYRTIEVPVLVSRISSDAIIKKSDLKWIRVRSSHLPRNTALNGSELIGMSPKRSLRASSPIRRTDLQKPHLVKKNSLVTIYHKVPNMTLTAKGKALDNGALNQSIRILNSRSKQTIEAKVIGYGRVTVLSPQFMAMK